MWPLIILLVGVIVTGLAAALISRERRLAAAQINRERFLTTQRTVAQIGGPISSVRWWLELLQDKVAVAGTDQDTAMMLQQMKEASGRLTAIMENLRRACDAEQGALPQNRAELPVAAMVTVATADTKGITRQKSQRLDVTVDPELLLETDPELLTGVIHELIENAAYYSGEKTVITVRAAKHGDRVLISVTDQGIGIAPDQIETIFEKFTRGPEAGNYKPMGSGLGLFVARTIVESLNGTLTCQSEPGKGSTFTINLPQR